MRQSVGIIGGGWSGLAAAVELTRAGHEVTVYEAGKLLGGRARCITAEPPHLDNGQHLLVGAYTETLRLMEIVEPGSSRNGFKRLPLTLEYPEGVSIRAPRLPAPFHLAAALLLARGISFEDKLAALRFMKSLKEIDFMPDASLTVADALADQPAAIRRYLWEPICVAALNTPVEKASFSVFTRVLKDSLTGSARKSDFLVPARDLSALFPEPAADWLAENGSKVMTRTRVTALQKTGKKWKLILEDGEAIHDKAIIATAPVHAIPLLEHLVDCREIAERLGSLGYQPIATVYATYLGPLRFKTPLLGWVDPVPLFIFDLNTCRPDIGEDSTTTIAVVASAEGEHLDWDDARWMDEINNRMRMAFGYLPPGRILKRVTEKRATFTCSPDIYRPMNAMPREGLFIAGDYTAGPYPSTLEGAVRSGVQCAETLLASS